MYNFFCSTTNFFVEHKTYFVLTHRDKHRKKKKGKRKENYS